MAIKLAHKYVSSLSRVFQKLKVKKDFPPKGKAQGLEAETFYHPTP